MCGSVFHISLLGVFVQEINDDDEQSKHSSNNELPFHLREAAYLSYIKGHILSCPYFHCMLDIATFFITIFLVLLTHFPS